MASAGPGGIGPAMAAGGRLLAEFAAPPFRGPFLVAGAALAAAASLDGHLDLPLLCGGGASDLAMANPGGIARLIFTLNAPDRLAPAWLVMLVAMMTPLIAVPLAHVRSASLKPRRTRAAAMFLLGYFTCWFLLGLPLIAVAIALRVLTGSGAIAFAVVLTLALLWSASPFNLAAQNRAHRLRRIALFGLGADRDCLRFGVTHGLWCFASCWAWMLVSLVAAQAHVAVMLAVTAITLGERLRRPGPPVWHWPPLLSPIVAIARRLTRIPRWIARYE